MGLIREGVNRSSLPRKQTLRHTGMPEELGAVFLRSVLLRE